MNNNRFLIEMGNRISKQRKSLNLTQEQVAEAMNISIQSLSCIELGKKAIRPENLVNLCAVLNVSTDYILTGKMTENQLNGITKKLSVLQDEDYKMIEMLINHFLAK